MSGFKKNPLLLSSPCLRPNTLSNISPSPNPTFAIVTYLRTNHLFTKPFNALLFPYNEYLIEKNQQEELSHIRRLPWFLAKLGTEPNSANARALLEDGEVEKREAMMVGRDQLLEVLAILPCRADKVVTVALGSKGVIYHEEDNDGRRDMDTEELSRDESTTYWISNYGIRLIDIASPERDSTHTPDRSFPEHVSYLFEYIQRIYLEPTESKVNLTYGLYANVLRISFPKTHSLINSHTQNLHPPNPKTSKLGKEKQPANFVDYTTLITPQTTTTYSALANLFTGNNVLNTLQHEMVGKYVGYQKEPRQLTERYTYIPPSTDFEKEAFGWLRDTFDLPPIDKTDPRSVHEYIGTLIFGFITGAHTIASAASPDFHERENPPAIAQMLSTSTWSTMLPNLRRGIESLVRFGIGLSGMLSGRFLLRHVGHVVRRREIAGYLNSIIRHFTAVSTLTSDRSISRVVIAKVYCLEVLTHGSHTKMMSVEDSFEKMRVGFWLGKDECGRLNTFLNGLQHDSPQYTHSKAVLFLLFLIAQSPQYNGDFPKELMDHFRIINPSKLGISIRRCCPTCATLSKIIAYRLGLGIALEPCLAVAPCSLSLWTPLDIIQEITMHLQSQVEPLLIQKAKQLRRAYKTDRGPARPPAPHSQPPVQLFRFGTKIADLKR